MVIWSDPRETTVHLHRRSQKRVQITETIDSNGFNWLVCAVASTGFFTDSYNLFATNYILPALAFAYWDGDYSTDHETKINVMTLTGSILGQLLFGYLADKYGRTTLYGFELLVVIISTIGVAQSSPGIGGSMSITASLMAWRGLMGIGIGAEYPLSATITAEWASVHSRARMLAGVTLMQPLGQLCASLVCLCTLIGLDHQYGLRNSTDNEKSAAVIDRLWRIVIGVGAIPALIAIMFRFTITDPGRYTFDVKDDEDLAINNTKDHFGSIASLPSLGIEENEIPVLPLDRDGEEDETIPVQFSWYDLKQYFYVEGNWRYLAGTSFCWAILDFAFYGMGMNNPRTLASLWASKPNTPLYNVPSWNPDYTQPNATIYEAIRKNLERSMITISVGSILGNLIMIKVINYVPRKKMLAWSFLWLALLLAATGGAFLRVFHTDFHAITIVLYAICELSFNLGPNTLIFIITAEIFPTRYRCTCNGVSAASGKLGSVIVQAILPHLSFNGVYIQDPNSNGLGYVLIIFAAVMAFGSVFAWAWIPDVQDGRREEDVLILASKTLEELAGGKKAAEEEGQIIGIRRNILNLWSRFWKRR